MSPSNRKANRRIPFHPLSKAQDTGMSHLTFLSTNLSEYGLQKATLKHNLETLIPDAELVIQDVTDCAIRVSPTSISGYRRSWQAIRYDLMRRSGGSQAEGMEKVEWFLYITTYNIGRSDPSARVGYWQEDTEDVRSVLVKKVEKDCEVKLEALLECAKRGAVLLQVEDVLRAVVRRPADE